MNFYSIVGKLFLFRRDEGKIKRYESCCDIRAWSHDYRTRNRYLREWIKSDLLISVIPGYTKAYICRTMTLKGCRRVIPQCSPDCKSRLLLESICTSCDGMRDCLRRENYFDKYFDEEELETTHWPCEKCLQVLKSIKMFWKIIVEKIFGIKYPTSEQTEYISSVMSIANNWKNEIVKQTTSLKNLTTPLINQDDIRGCDRAKSKRKDIKSRKVGSNLDTNQTVIAKMDNCSMTSKINSSATFCLSDRQISKRNRRKRKRNVDVGVNCCFNDDVNKELEDCKEHLLNLQTTLCEKNIELKQLKHENDSLKQELDNLYRKCPWKQMFAKPADIIKEDDLSIIPKPFDDDGECTQYSLKAIESEMMITMKKCKTENYEYVSLLQILHKSNNPGRRELDVETCCTGDRQEDPIVVLAKVQSIFRGIVRREMCIASERKQTQKFEISATYCGIPKSDLTNTTNNNINFPCEPNLKDCSSVKCLNC